MARLKLPPGFRFHPTDVELLMFYLKRKILGKKFAFEAISELNIYNFTPMDLPDKSCLCSKDLEWYFFCPREKKYASGARAKRMTENGYWKATGKDRSVIHNGRAVGTVKTLVFHEGHAPIGIRTDWVIHEYRINDSSLADAGVSQDDYVICKVFKKSGPGPRNGAQYGAPFNEEDWDDDIYFESLPIPGLHNKENDREGICFGSSPVPGLDNNENNNEGLCSESLPVSGLHNNEHDSNVTNMITSEGAHSLAGIVPEQFPLPATHPLDEMPPLPEDSELSALLAMLSEDNDLLPVENNANEKLGSFIEERGNLSASCSDENDVLNGGGDLGYLDELTGSEFSLPEIQETSHELKTTTSANLAFLELSDLDIPLTYPSECNEFEGRVADKLCAHNKCYDKEQFSCGTATQRTLSSSQCYVLPNSYHQQQNHIPVLQGETGKRQCVNSENETNSYHTGFTGSSQVEQSRLGLRHGKRSRFH